MISICPVCGNHEFSHKEVLWPDLVTAWELSEKETDYINRQQGFCCTSCGNNLRSMALATAIIRSFEYPGTLAQFCSDKKNSDLRVLEINPAGMLTPNLSLLNRHRLISYPEYDMAALALESASYDLIIHSDTLEHVADPAAAMKECLRVLSPKGRCIFTVPIVIDRLSRSRQGLPPSYHGNPAENTADLLVHTEFGADAWSMVLKAGFSSCTLYCLEYPAGIAIDARP